VIRHFIFTLGSDFEAIQHNFRIGNLPSQWNTQDWPTLLVLCRDYFNSVKPQGVSRKDPSGDNNNFDSIAQHKKVKEWFLNPTKFLRGIEAEQRKHSGKCIFHLSKSHTTADCNIRKECDKIIVDKKETVTMHSTSGSGHLHHIQDDMFEDALSEDIVADSIAYSPNDTNEDDLLYFACMTNHYLCLVKTSMSIPIVSRHDMKYPIIADSGANYHMFKEREFFDTLHPASGRVLLGDGKTARPIKGIGTV
jgi:hypothetical protein